MDLAGKLPVQAREVMQGFISQVLNEGVAVLTRLSLIDHTATMDEADEVIEAMCSSPQSELTELSLHHNPRLFQTE